MTANGQYSTIIRPCTGSSYDPMTEPGPYAWALENSVENGKLTLRKTFYFTLNGYSGTSFWGGDPSAYDVCPAEVLRSSGFPQKWDRLAEDTNYHFTGDGTLRHLRDNDRIWAFDAEYTAKAENDSDGNARKHDTKPWKRKPENVTIELDEIECPLVVGLDKDNKRFKAITSKDVGNVGYLVRQASNHNNIRNSAGDPINARGTRYVIKVKFTYWVKPSDFDASMFIDCIGSVNKKDVQIIGIKIKSGCARIVELHPQYFDQWDSDSFSTKTTYWEVNTTIQLSMNGDSFNQKLLNTGSRAKFYKSYSISTSGSATYTSGSAIVDDVFAWQTWDGTNGQVLGAVQYGPKEAVVMAERKYKAFSAGKGLPDFSYKKMEGVPLTSSGFVDADALNPNSTRFGDYLVIEPLEFQRKDWDDLNFPKNGVNWG